MSTTEEPRVGVHLRWEDVSLPPTITVVDLDGLIFSALKSDWRKTSTVVGSVGITCQTRSTPLSFKTIAARIQCLAEAGMIECQGDISLWRHSEVRLRD